MSLADEPPDAEPVALLGDMDAQRVAGHDGAPEPRIVDTHEIDQLALGLAPNRLDDEHCGSLGHRLDDQHARHHRALREVAGEIGLVDRHVLDADGTGVRHDLDDPVDHQKRVAMRNHRANPLDVEIRHAALLAGRIHPIRPSLARAAAPPRRSAHIPSLAGLENRTRVAPERRRERHRYAPPTARLTRNMCPIYPRLSITVPSPMTISGPAPVRPRSSRRSGRESAN